MPAPLTIAPRAPELLFICVITPLSTVYVCVADSGDILCMKYAFCLHVVYALQHSYRGPAICWGFFLKSKIITAAIKQTRPATRGTSFRISHKHYLTNGNSP